MTLDFITEMYIPIVLVICLCVGYVAKMWLPQDNKWIPTIVTILGAVLGCVAQGGIHLAAIGAGAVTGLASTGLHQLFTQLIFKNEFEVIEREDLNDEDEEDEK